jgi:hypothetical protein
MINTANGDIAIPYHNGFQAGQTSTMVRTFTLQLIGGCGRLHQHYSDFGAASGITSGAVDR